jgi:hypothetical protein
VAVGWLILARAQQRTMPIVGYLSGQEAAAISSARDLAAF